MDAVRRRLREGAHYHAQAFSFSASSRFPQEDQREPEAHAHRDVLEIITRTYREIETIVPSRQLWYAVARQDRRCPSKRIMFGRWATQQFMEADRPLNTGGTRTLGVVSGQGEWGE